MTETAAAKLYYYGCYQDVGHYMFARGYRQDAKFVDLNPWGSTVDGGLCPPGSQVQGNALIHHKDGWTALSFYDRSVDRRPGSNSSFLALGTYSFEQMAQIAQRYFPEVVNRFSFPITDASQPG